MGPVSAVGSLHKGANQASVCLSHRRRFILGCPHNESQTPPNLFWSQDTEWYGSSRALHAHRSCIYLFMLFFVFGSLCTKKGTIIYILCFLSCMPYICEAGHFTRAATLAPVIAHAAVNSPWHDFAVTVRNFQKLKFCGLSWFVIISKKCFQTTFVGKYRGEGSLTHSREVVFFCLLIPSVEPPNNQVNKENPNQHTTTATTTKLKQPNKTPTTTQLVCPSK